MEENLLNSGNFSSSCSNNCGKFSTKQHNHTPSLLTSSCGVMIEILNDKVAEGKSLHNLIWLLIKQSMMFGSVESRCE
ncbi:CLUMA_CG002451, isoform A [Clunio marinus]|uniref:CLUMA_CG002451, isoform A n=1 Tax=Clunio marinus TaxID=568069 RepID=A0A1J1HMQ7_9DIPT|nr:CLUMA_CG002451, isoform A [Clunio marinus]